MAEAPIIRLNDVSKAYDGSIAVEHVDLQVFPGEILGLVGPNGSGKTTLTNIMSGNLWFDSGRMEFLGNPVHFSSPAHAIAAGVRVLSQYTETFPSMTVLENIFIGQEISRRWPIPQLMAWRAMHRKCQELLCDVDAPQISPDWIVSHLSGGQQKAVSLARLLVNDAKVLIFDEPAGALGVRQKQRLLNLLQRKAEAGKTVILISHDIADVLAVCSRVVMLSRGRITDTVDSKLLTAETLKRHMERN